MIIKFFNKFRWIFGFLLLVIALLPGIYFYNKYTATKKLLDNPKKVSNIEKSDLLKKIGKLIDLPGNEDPTIATVQDVKKLSTNPFFAKAENGDRALFYTKAKRAILYRPSINKIIEVSQINVEQANGSGTNIDSSGLSATPTKTVTSITPTIQTKGRLAIYNGTKIAGLANKEKDFILSRTTNLEVTKIGETINSYNENLVVNLKGSNDTAAKQLAELMEGKVSSLPAGELAPTNTDLLLIIGKE